MLAWMQEFRGLHERARPEPPSSALREIGGDEFVADLVDTFLNADAPPLLAALHGTDADEVRRAAHTLKSNGATFGATRFSELCRELEEQAKAGDLTGASELAGRIESEYALVAEGAAAMSTAAGRVLVVDDNRVNQLLLGRGLEQQGHSIEFAGARPRGARPAPREPVRPDAARRPDARGRRLPGAGRDEGRPAPSRPPGDHDLRARRARQRRQVHRDGRRGLPDEADQRGAAQGPRPVEPREEAPARPAARADQQVRHPRGRRGPADVGILARRQVRRSCRDVLRHPLVHRDRGDRGPRRDDRAAERLLHADDGCDRR